MATTFPGTALVTGAAGGKTTTIVSRCYCNRLTNPGIGAATAIAFAKAGCTRIAITDIQPSALEQTRQEILSTSSTTEGSINVIAIPGDITSESFIETTLIADAFTAFGRLDYVVNCAGVLQNEFARSTDVSAQQFDFINSVNYRGAWLVSRAALRRMLTQEPLTDGNGNEEGGESWRPKQRGSIVNIASQLGVVSRAGAAAYCASKAAVIGLTRADAIDFSKDLIRVNCVCPGVIDTNMTTSSPERVEAMAPAVKIAPMGRMGDPREVADAVLFLSSSRASFVQGHALVVDGGYVIN